MPALADPAVQKRKFKIIPVLPMSSVVVVIIIVQRLQYPIPVSLPGHSRSRCSSRSSFTSHIVFFTTLTSPGSVFGRLTVYIIGGVIYVIIIINYKQLCQGGETMNREEKRATRYRAMFRHYPDALTPAQVQEMLGVGRRMTYGLLRRGEIQSVRMGRLYRVPKVAVIDYLCGADNTEKT